MKAATFAFRATALLIALPAPQANAAEAGRLVRGDGLDEIVVTARKREENLQDVPLSVTALSQAALERASARGLADVARLTPGLSFNDVAGGLYSMPVIRGLSQILRFTDSNRVGVFVDGIYLPNRQSLNLDMLDLERVEVLKGPQSTLYGQSTFSGAINYVTRSPEQGLGGFVSGGLGTDEWREARLAVGGSLGGSALTGRIAVGYQSTDGTHRNLGDPGEKLGGNEARSVHGALRWELSEVLTLDAGVYYSENEWEHAPLYWVANNCGQGPTGAPTTFCGDLPADRSADISPQAFGSDTENLIGRLQVSWAPTDRLRLTNVAALVESSGSNRSDSDGTSAGFGFPVRNTATGAQRTANSNIWFGFGNQEDEAFSDELRLAFDGERVDWMVGGYYYELDGDRATTLSIDSSVLGPSEVFLNPLAVLFGTRDPFGAPVVNSATAVTVETRAIFGQLSWQFAPRTRLGAELRYTEEGKSQRILVNSRLPSNQFDADTWYYVSPRLSIDHKLRDDVMLFASVAEGTSSGGFNNLVSPNAPQDKSYDAETNRTYEVGLRSAWHDGRLLANLTLFASRIEDLQITARSSDPAFLFARAGNLGGADTMGIELETQALVGEHLRIGLGYAYSNPQLDDGQVELGSNGCGVGASICRRRPNGDVDISGNDLPFAHDHQLSVAVDYERPLSDRWRWHAHLDLGYQSSATVDTTELTRFGERTLVGLHLGLKSRRYSMSIWARNLLDERYVSTAYYQNRVNGQRIVEVVPGEGRVIGVTARVSFD